MAIQEFFNHNIQTLKTDALLDLCTLRKICTLKQIDYPGSGNNSEFVYDGNGRNTKIVETQNNVATGTKQFVWSTHGRCEIRDTSGNPVARFFGRGEVVSGTNYYFTKDHLSSIREVTDNSGNIQAELTYDPYGRATKLQGSFTPDFAYAGYYQHAASGLSLTVRRAYSPSLGRWINRDPIEEDGGINLYEYGLNDPESHTDPSGTFIAAAAAIILANPELAALIAAGAVTAGTLAAQGWKELAPEIWEQIKDLAKAIKAKMKNRNKKKLTCYEIYAAQYAEIEAKEQLNIIILGPEEAAEIAKAEKDVAWKMYLICDAKERGCFNPPTKPLGPP